MKLTKKTAYLLFVISVIADTIAWSFLEAAEAFTNTGATIGVIISFIITWWCFAKALKCINLAVAYASWTAVGTIATSVIGVVLFHQILSPVGWGAIIVMIIGVFLLTFYGTPEEKTENEEGEKEC